MNAEDIPNNPYSAEALQRRLSQTKNPSKIIDINLELARAKSIDDPSTKPDAENGKPLQIVLGAGEPDHMRLVLKFRCGNANLNFKNAWQVWSRLLHQ